MDYDLVIRGGTVIDGSGAAGVRADVAIKDRRISAVLDPDSPGIMAGRMIDARGQTVAPGFVDLHSHSDWVTPLPEHREILKPFLLQGVTTIVGGNCGFSTAPVRLGHSALLDGSGQMLSDRKFDWKWQTVGELATHLKSQGLALNVAHLAGHGSIRLSVMGGSPAEPSNEQLREMKSMLAGAMADGAVGLSTGLGYFPGMIAKPPELAALASVAAEAGGVLTSHLRAYSTESAFFSGPEPHNLQAVMEMVEVARQAKAPLQISHLIFVGRRSYPSVSTVLAGIERARDSGADVAFDTFPYTCGNTTIRVFYPAWAQNGLEQLLCTTEGWARLRATFAPISGYLAYSTQLMWAVKPELRHLEGRFFSEIADELKLDPVDAYLTVTRESGTRARILNHRYSGDERGEDALRAAMSHPLNLFEMDTILTSHGHQNPASFGTYPRILGYYVREQSLLGLEDAVHKMTGGAAERMRLGKRGLVREGYAADLCIFDPATIGCDADARVPSQEVTGISHVLVNGQPVVAEGKWCGDGMLAGEWLTRA